MSSPNLFGSFSGDMFPLVGVCKDDDTRRDTPALACPLAFITQLYRFMKDDTRRGKAFSFFSPTSHVSTTSVVARDDAAPPPDMWAAVFFYDLCYCRVSFIIAEILPKHQGPAHLIWWGSLSRAYPMLKAVAPHAPQLGRFFSFCFTARVFAPPRVLGRRTNHMWREYLVSLRGPLLPGSWRKQRRLISAHTFWCMMKQRQQVLLFLHLPHIHLHLHHLPLQRLRTGLRRALLTLPSLSGGTLPE